MLVFSDHAFDVMLAVFFGKFRDVCKCVLNFLLVGFGGRGFVLKRVSGLVRGEGEIWVVINVTNDKFKTQFKGHGAVLR